MPCKVKLTPQAHAQLARARRVNPEAYEAYLKGRYYFWKGAEESNRKAIDYLEQALKTDPNYGPAYAGLADCYWWTDELPPSVAFPKAKGYALKALEIDTALPEAHTSLGTIRFQYDWDWSSAEEEFKSALALNPSSALAHHAYAEFLAWLGRLEEALAEIKQAQELDPLSRNIRVTFGLILEAAKSYVQAMAQCQSALELDPHSGHPHGCLAAVYESQRRWHEAVAEYEKAVSLAARHPVYVAALARVYARLGRKEEAEKLVQELLERKFVPPYLVAGVFAGLGRRAQAVEWLEKSYRERDGYLVRLKMDQAFEPLRDDPRFQALLRRMNFPE